MDMNFNHNNPAVPRRSNVLGIILTVVVIGVLLALGCMVYMKHYRNDVTKLSSPDAYQSVFLTNGQVYFGKLSAEGKWLVLKDIYYLQVTQELQPASQNGQPSQAPSGEQPNIQLVKLGSELHGPEDRMYIDREKILFWENMKDDSKVVQAIKKHQGQ